MAGTLGNIMSVGSESMQNARVGVDVTGHNISNAHTPGYSRQKLNLENNAPSAGRGGITFGNGAKLESVERAHDSFIETTIRKEQQKMGRHDATASGLAKLENNFNPELNTTVRDRMNTFNNALRELANFPEEHATRTNVVESGNAFAQTVNYTFNLVAEQQSDLTKELSSNCTYLTQKLEEVANLNQRIKEMESGTASRPNDLLDQRDAAVKDIANTIDCQQYVDGNGQVVLRGPGGTLMVEGVNYAKFYMADKPGADLSSVVMLDLFNQSETNVTEKLDSGKMAGMIDIRDNFCERVKGNLNELARTYASDFNKIHKEAFGKGEYANTTGRDFFVGHNEENPATALSVNLLVLNDIDAVSAALSPNASGDNIMANELVKIADNASYDDGRINFSQFYDKMVSRVGIDTMKSREEMQASKIVMGQLAAQKESVAGVSLDEEAANLLKYQQLFQASSRIITTADEMMETVLGLKR